MSAVQLACAEPAGCTSVRSRGERLGTPEKHLGDAWGRLGGLPARGPPGVQACARVGNVWKFMDAELPGGYERSLAWEISWEIP